MNQVLLLIAFAKYSILGVPAGSAPHVNLPLVRKSVEYWKCIGAEAPIRSEARAQGRVRIS